jgi:magnesium transporter
MYYLIKDLLQECGAEEIKGGEAQYLAILTSEEWKEHREDFDMVIDMDRELTDRSETKAVVNYDSLTGSFSVPDRTDFSRKDHTFAFALDEKGIVLIDDEGYALDLVRKIQRTKKWRLPSLERFLYDFLEEMIGGDLYLLESIEAELDRTEKRILADEVDKLPAELNDIRGDLLDLRAHYEQLIDFGQELQENENGFFKTENLRYFKLFTERVMRLQDIAASLREYVVQLRDLVQSQLGVRQNKIMTLLTVVTSIFLPLSLIAGWYGMNVRYMPELEMRFAYPAVILVSVAIVVGCLIWFKKKKWL